MLHQESTVVPIFTCDDCKQAANLVLVNGEDRTHYCKYCLSAAAGEIVMDNDRITFRWNKDHTICELD